MMAGEGNGASGNERAPFHPPYLLGGSTAVLLGLSPDPLPDTVRAKLGRWRPLRLWGWTVAVVVASRFDDPPAEQPVAYDEVIVALLLVSGLRLATLPLSMKLDDRLPVEEGHVHYSLPKSYDPTLSLTLGPGEPLRIVGEDLRVEAEPAAGWRRWARLLPCHAFALGARAFTAAVPVLGLAETPFRRAVVALRPVGAGRPLDVRVAQLPDLRFSPLWAQAFGRCATWLGPPVDLPAGEVSDGR